MNRILSLLTLAGIGVLVVTNPAGTAQIIKAVSGGMDNYVSTIGRGTAPAALG